MYELKATVQSAAQSVVDWPAPGPKHKKKTPSQPQASDFHDPFPKTSASLKPTRLPKKIQVNAKHEIIRTSSQP